MNCVSAMLVLSLPLRFVLALVSVVSVLVLVSQLRMDTKDSSQIFHRSHYL